MRTDRERGRQTDRQTDRQTHYNQKLGGHGQIKLCHIDLLELRAERAHAVADSDETFD